MQTNKAGGWRQWAVPLLLAACVAIVAFWEIMAARSRRPFMPFEMGVEDFRGFAPSSPLWSVRPLSIPPDPVEPNIVAYEVRRVPGEAGGRSAAPVLVRLVHGYNMCDCMRIKGYRVELIETVGRRDEPASGRAPFRQVWRLTSSTAEVSIWITGMIRAGDFGETDVDVRSLAFPRIGIPDDPSWLPRGITWSSLRHPIRNARLALRAKWNSSRCDLATFLGLRQPAWADDELLTLVATGEGASVKREDEPRVTESVLAAYDFVYAELKRWRSESGPGREF